MKNICIIYLNLSDEIINLDADVIGVEKGALFLAKKNINMVAAIGDFDSIKENEILEIKKYTNKIKTYSTKKDCSDSELALKYAVSLGYEHIILTGAIGERLDHSYNNMLLCYKYKDFDITLREKNNKVFLLKNGIHIISKSHYKYLSIFPIDDTTISTIGFKYPLNNRKLKAFENIGLSNEIIQNFATIQIHHGHALIIQSDEK